MRIGAFATGLCLWAFTLAAVGATPLDDYINKPDPHFTFSDLGVVLNGTGWTGYVWNMTSQQYLTFEDVDRSIWWHYLVIIIPHEVKITPDTAAFLYITGGSNTDGIPKATTGDILIAATVAMGAKCPAAVLFQVPNQPLKFPVDPFHESRSEDGAIALTWWYFIYHPTKFDWILELPMTKSGVRALDAMDAILPMYLNGSVINKYGVAGASKRGWTTWLVGAVDKRVIAIIPIVLDALNVVAFAHRQWQMYGAWSFALQDYYKMNITGLWDHPGMKQLMETVDPWYYLKRLTMPKLAVNAGGDEFQMPDDQRHWGHDTVGEMQYLLVKNAEHSLATGILEVIPAVGAFVQAFTTNTPRPKYEWFYDESNGDMTVVTDTPPTVVTVSWSDSGTGISEGRRDFRWAALNVSFCPVKVFGGCVRPLLWATSSTEGLTRINSTAFRVHFDTPASGWRAFILEMQWPNPSGPDNFYFTSPASVVPPKYPFPDCNGWACFGKLC